jgi:serine phosphatase RsbU (regulator of sigma subunit)
MRLTAAEMLEALRREATSFCNGAFDDDLTLVIVTVK